MLQGCPLCSGLVAGSEKKIPATGAPLMIFGAHVIVFSNDASADRAFFRDVLGYSSVDAGHDWLIKIHSMDR
jgi:hypothetical protein